jgi:hypothetical protein
VAILELVDFNTGQEPKAAKQTKAKKDKEKDKVKDKVKVKEKKKAEKKEAVQTGTAY